MHWPTDTLSNCLRLTKILDGCLIVRVDKRQIRYCLRVTTDVPTVWEADWPLLTPATISLRTEIMEDLSTGSTNHGSTKGVACRAESMPIRPLEVTFCDLGGVLGSWSLHTAKDVMLTNIQSSWKFDYMYGVSQDDNPIGSFSADLALTEGRFDDPLGRAVPWAWNRVSEYIW